MKLFFVWTSSYAKSYKELIEVTPGIFAQTEQTERRINSYEESVSLDTKRTVVEVFAKNKVDLDIWDMETAQAKTDMIISDLNSIKLVKVRKKLMCFEAYKNYNGKIAFAKTTNSLRSSKANQPVENLLTLLQNKN